MDRAKKGGNKYLEAGAYANLSLIYLDKRDINTSKNYLIKAYNLFKDIGAENEAKETMRLLDELNKLERLMKIKRKR